MASSSQSVSASARPFEILPEQQKLQATYNQLLETKKQQIAASLNQIANDPRDKSGEIILGDESYKVICFASKKEHRIHSFAVYGEYLGRGSSAFVKSSLGTFFLDKTHTTYQFKPLSKNGHKNKIKQSHLPEIVAAEEGDEKKFNAYRQRLEDMFLYMVYSNPGKYFSNNDPSIEEINQAALVWDWENDSNLEARSKDILSKLEPAYNKSLRIARQQAAKFERIFTEELAILSRVSQAKKGLTIAGFSSAFFSKQQQGITLDKFYRKYILTAEQKEQLIRAMIEAYIEGVENKAFVNSDIKPENILVDLYQGQFQIRFFDWGLAQPRSKDKKLLPGSRGSLFYSAPELLVTFQSASGQRFLGAYAGNSDVFSLGCVFAFCYDISRYSLLELNGDIRKFSSPANKTTQTSAEAVHRNLHLIPENLRPLILAMTTCDYRSRPYGKEALQLFDDFVSDNASSSLPQDISELPTRSKKSQVGLLLASLLEYFATEVAEQQANANEWQKIQMATSDTKLADSYLEKIKAQRSYLEKIEKQNDFLLQVRDAWQKENLTEFVKAQLDNALPNSLENEMLTYLLKEEFFTEFYDKPILTLMALAEEVKRHEIDESSESDMSMSSSSSMSMSMSQST